MSLCVSVDPGRGTVAGSAQALAYLNYLEPWTGPCPLTPEARRAQFGRILESSGKEQLVGLGGALRGLILLPGSYVIGPRWALVSRRMFGGRPSTLAPRTLPNTTPTASCNIMLLVCGRRGRPGGGSRDRGDRVARAGRAHSHPHRRPENEDHLRNGVRGSPAAPVSKPLPHPQTKSGKLHTDRHNFPGDWHHQMSWGLEPCLPQH